MADTDPTPRTEAWAILRNSLSKAHTAKDIDEALDAARTAIEAEARAELDVGRLAVTYHRRRHNPRAVASACDQCRRDAGLVATEYAALARQKAPRG